MKRIIDGKRYNTDTAEEIQDHYSNGMSESDFGFYHERLYRTKRGSWFIAGRGGPMTRWGERVGNMTGYGRGILPITGEDARAWLENYGDNDLLEQYFADDIEDA